MGLFSTELNWTNVGLSDRALLSRYGKIESEAPVSIKKSEEYFWLILNAAYKQGTLLTAFSVCPGRLGDR